MALSHLGEEGDYTREEERLLGDLHGRPMCGQSTAFAALLDLDSVVLLLQPGSALCRGNQDTALLKHRGDVGLGEGMVWFCLCSSSTEDDNSEVTLLWHCWVSVSYTRDVQVGNVDIWPPKVPSWCWFVQRQRHPCPFHLSMTAACSCLHYKQDLKPTERPYSALHHTCSFLIARRNGPFLTLVRFITTHKTSAPPALWFA